MFKRVSLGGLDVPVSRRESSLRVVALCKRLKQSINEAQTSTFGARVSLCYIFVSQVIG